MSRFETRLPLASAIVVPLGLGPFILGGCSSPGESDDSFVFRKEVALPSGETHQATASTVGDDILIVGTMLLPSVCDDGAGFLGRSGQGLALVVARRVRNVESCPHSPGVLKYEARILDLPPGILRIRVVHRINADIVITVLDEDIAVSAGASLYFYK